MHLKFLGTSSGLGIPRVGCECPQCQSKDPRDRRTRSTLLVDNKILIDCGPDIIRQIQSSKLKVQKLTHAIITHQHFDHIGGINKLKVKNKKLKIIYLDKTQKFKIGNLGIISKTGV